MSRNNKEAGLVQIVNPEADRPSAEYAMKQCVHCGGQFPSKTSLLVASAGRTYTPAEALLLKQIGVKTRGWCTRCQGPLCGPECAECIPTEQYLDNLEHGRPLDYYPAQAGYTPPALEVPGAKPGDIWTPAQPLATIVHAGNEHACTAHSTLAPEATSDQANPADAGNAD